MLRIAPILLLLSASALASDMPYAAGRTLAKRELRAEIAFSSKVPVQVTAVLPGGEPSPTDASVERLAQAEGLVWLDLTQTRTTNRGLAALARAKQLETLDLRECTVVTNQGIEKLKGLKTLRALGLEAVPITDRGLKALKKMKSLRALDLSLTRVTDSGVSSLASLPRLEWLALNGLPVGDKAVRFLGKSKAIAHLDLVDTQVTVKGLRVLTGKSSLVDLRLRGPMLTDAGLAVAASCPNLRRLYLHNAEAITDKGILALGKLAGMETLGISAAPKLTDAIVETLAAWKSLKWLNLYRCSGLTPAGVARLRQALPECRIVGPDDRKLRPSGPATVRPR